MLPQKLNKIEQSISMSTKVSEPLSQEAETECHVYNNKVR